MAAYEFTLDQTRVRRGDYPALTGSITGPSGEASGSGDLAAATIAYVKSPSSMPSEAAVALTASGFSYQYTDPLRDAGKGNVYLRVFPKVVGLTAVLASGIDDNDTSVSLTVSAGTLPDRGWMVLESEIVEFEKTGAAAATITRAQFGTVAAAHLSAVACVIAAGSVTCETAARLEVYEEQIWP